MQLCFELLLNC